MTSATTSSKHGTHNANIQTESKNMSTTDSAELVDTKDTIKEESKDLLTTSNEDVADNVASKDSLLKHDDHSLQGKVEELERSVKSKANKIKQLQGLLKTEKNKKQLWQRLVHIWRSRTEELLNKCEKSSDVLKKEDVIVIEKGVTNNMQESVSDPETVHGSRHESKPTEHDVKDSMDDKAGDDETNRQLLILEECMQACLDAKMKTHKEIQSLKGTNKELLDRLSTYHDSLDTLGKERDNLQKEMNSLRKKITKLSETVNDAEESLRTTENERDRLNDDVQAYETENEQLSQSLNKAKDEVRCLEKHIAEMKGPVCSTGRKKRKKYFMEQENLRLKDELEELHLRVKKKDDQISTMYHENNRLKEEADKLRLRLSEIAGSLLVHRNPTIADLSDVTRPTKLAEIFSELYDNQWTEAFEEQKGSKQKIIQYLLGVLMTIHSKCQNVSSAYLSELEDKINIIPGTDIAIFEKKADIPVTTRKFLTEIRRSVSEYIIRVLITNFRSKFIQNKKKSGKEMEATAVFIDRCTELCWYMVIKDPPVTLGNIPKEGEPVNKELFKCYTRSGQYVDYCVWPPLLLYEDGPVLCKGIVQAK